MKKITLTSILALCMACPAMADIAKEANSATCDSSTIGTTTGPANLQAAWTPNTINLEWYSNNTELEVGSTSATCSYDGAITLPSTPTVPTGYTFGGWKVRPRPFDLSTLAQYINIGATSFAYIEFTGKSSKEGGYYNPTTPDVYNLTTPGEFAAEFSYGTVKGEALCADADGEFATAGTPNNTTYRSGCWCKVTGFDAEKDGSYTPVTSSSWVYYYNFGPEEYCLNMCADNCAFLLWDEYSYDFRRSLYGITQ